jgi:hypothetical protein
MQNDRVSVVTTARPSLGPAKGDDLTVLRLRTHARALGWTTEALEQARQMRVEAGLRILSAPDPGQAVAASSEQLLESIARKETTGPVPALAREYRQKIEQEREMRRILEELIQEHPAWLWLRDVPGVELISAGRLLSRLDVTRAPTPSAFWAYCGLATVPGVRHRCALCGFECALAEGSHPPASHMAVGTSEECVEVLQPVAGPSLGRVAQPKPGAGSRSAYDMVAKTICYTIGGELRNAGHRYGKYYLQQRGALERSRFEWPSGRRHMTALRKMQKLFLAHLWLVWRQGMNLPITEPSPTEADHLDPWAMTAQSRRRWARREDAVPHLR